MATERGKLATPGEKIDKLLHACRVALEFLQKLEDDPSRKRLTRALRLELIALPTVLREAIARATALVSDAPESSDQPPGIAKPRTGRMARTAVHLKGTK